MFDEFVDLVLELNMWKQTLKTEKRKEEDKKEITNNKYGALPELRNTSPDGVSSGKAKVVSSIGGVTGVALVVLDYL